MNANIPNTPDIGEMITKMLSDPESLGKVMNMVGALSASGAFSGNTPEAPKIHEEAPREERSDTHAVHAPIKGHEAHHRERPRVNQCDRIRLLEAMRPFLGEDKRAKLDMVIKLLGLAEAAGGLYSFKI
ncbi:MAG: hypothetical protein E7626_01090 [Ruminococcaceae bacterium]|nr:hypothetical protein [Oscillospiraceae bacterium]